MYQLVATTTTTTTTTAPGGRQSNPVSRSCASLVDVYLVFRLMPVPKIASPFVWWVVGSHLSPFLSPDLSALVARVLKSHILTHDAWTLFQLVWAPLYRTCGAVFRLEGECPGMCRSKRGGGRVEGGGGCRSALKVRPVSTYNPPVSYGELTAARSIYLS